MKYESRMENKKRWCKTKFKTKILHYLKSIHNKFGISAKSWECGRHAGGFSLCGNAREKEVKCGSLPQNAGELATMYISTTTTGFIIIIIIIIIFRVKIKLGNFYDCR